VAVWDIFFEVLLQQLHHPSMAFEYPLKQNRIYFLSSALFFEGNPTI
jgi:hypothetical protein